MIIQRESSKRKYTRNYQNFLRQRQGMSNLKINTLKAQLGKEIAKESKTKSGQATSQQYMSKLTFYDKLEFLLPILALAKSRDSTGSFEGNLKCSISFTKIEPFKSVELKENCSCSPNVQNWWCNHPLMRNLLKRLILFL